MKAVLRLFVVVSMVLSGLLLAPAASAHDPESPGDHTQPGASGPDLHSQNVKLLANVPKAAGTTTQSDLAFWGKHAFAGNYQGFRVLDISDPESPTVVTDFRCNGAQGDVSVYRGLLFQSVDSPQSNGSCTSTNVTASTPGMFEGVRIFDISNPASPVLLASIATDCGSHTHTLAPRPATGEVFVYVSSYPLGNAAQGPNCRRLEEGDGHGKVSIIRVPLAAPASATVGEYHLDEATQVATYPIAGTTSFTACHDISVFTGINRAAAACMSEAQMWDISDPANPTLLWRYDNAAVQPANIDLFHSATFSWDGRIVAFGDESGGGGAARCTDPDDNRGRIWFVDAVTGAELAGYKVPRVEPSVCTMHNFNFIPLPGRNVLVSSAYTAGTTVIDVDRLITGATPAEAEIGFYRVSGGNAWSSYWYNNFIYANDINRGVDVFLLSDRARAGARQLPYLNPQTQESLLR